MSSSVTNCSMAPLMNFTIENIPENCTLQFLNSTGFEENQTIPDDATYTQLTRNELVVLASIVISLAIIFCSFYVLVVTVVTGLQSEWQPPPHPTPRAEELRAPQPRVKRWRIPG